MTLDDDLVKTTLPIEPQTIGFNSPSISEDYSHSQDTSPKKKFQLSDIITPIPTFKQNIGASFSPKEKHQIQIELKAQDIIKL